MKFQTKKKFLAPLNLSSIINGYNFSYTEDYGLKLIYHCHTPRQIRKKNCVSKAKSTATIGTFFFTSPSSQDYFPLIGEKNTHCKDTKSY